MAKGCVVIPAYNEEENIGRVILGIHDILKRLDCPYDILVINDGSKDNTVRVAREAGAIVWKIKHGGKGKAKQTGFDLALKAKSDIIITMDGDGQHDPEDIEKFLSLWQDTEADIIIGSRRSDMSSMPHVRYLTNRILSLINSLLCGQYLPDSQCDFRLIKKGVFKKVRILTPGFESDTEFLLKAARYGFKIKSVPIKTIYLERRKSRINPVLDTIRYIKLLLKSIFW